MSELAPLVDRSVVDELLASVMGDASFVRDLVETFAGEAEEHLGALAAAAERRDAAASVRPAHTLKSSGAIIGAMRLSELCRGIEAAARAGFADDLAAQSRAARSTWRETLEIYRAEGFAS
jgi:HPt (histidine-containing phosphotransfer) domain-containing protein